MLSVSYETGNHLDRRAQTGNRTRFSGLNSPASYHLNDLSTRSKTLRRESSLPRIELGTHPYEGCVLAATLQNHRPDTSGLDSDALCDGGRTGRNRAQIRDIRSGVVSVVKGLFVRLCLTSTLLSSTSCEELLAVPRGLEPPTSTVTR